MLRGYRRVSRAAAKMFKTVISLWSPTVQWKTDSLHKMSIKTQFPLRRCRRNDMSTYTSPWRNLIVFVYRPLLVFSFSFNFTPENRFCLCCFVHSRLIVTSHILKTLIKHHRISNFCKFSLILSHQGRIWYICIHDFLIWCYFYDVQRTSNIWTRLSFRRKMAKNGQKMPQNLTLCSEKSVPQRKCRRKCSFR